MSDDEKEPTPPQGTAIPRPRPPPMPGAPVRLLGSDGSIASSRLPAPESIDAESKLVTLRAIFDVAEETRDAVRALGRHVLGDPTIIRISSVPGPNSLMPPLQGVEPAPGEPRPSLPARAAQTTLSGTKWLGKWGVLVSGGLAIAGQLVALWKPEYAGPLIQALRLLASLGGSETPPAPPQ